MPAVRSSKRRKTGPALPGGPRAPALPQDRSLESVSGDLFKYSPLEPQNDEIRLLKILPERRFDGISCGLECEISHAQLSKDLDYEALSYVWGDQSDVQTISLNGSSFSVTVNLYFALMELRAMKRQSPIWIDAICINQTDTTERSDQVRKMGRVFSSANHVIAWLGEKDEESELAMHLIRVLKRGIENRQQTRERIQDPEYLNHFYGLYKLFYRDYWWRVWVIQEVALSNGSITILCGEDHLPWLDLVQVQEELAAHHLPDIDSIAHERDELSFLRPTIESRGPRALLLPAIPNATSDLSQILLKHRFKESTDPKDKVYSLVGLSNARDDPRFILDYSRTVREVYMDLISYVALTTKKIDIICAMPRGPNSHGLPSWTPDWSFGGLGSSMLNESFEHQYNAAGHSLADITISADGILLVKGICVTAVSAIGAPSKMNDLEDQANAIRAFFDWYKLMITFRGENEVAKESFCRTMLLEKLDRDIEGLEEPDFLLEAFGAFVKAGSVFCSEVKMDPNLTDGHHDPLSDVIGARLVKASREMTFGRRFFMTTSNLPALGPDTILKGDMICVILGCQLPIVLRPEEDHYLFLGETYVDGYMYGLAIEELEADKSKARQFEIH